MTEPLSVPLLHNSVIRSVIDSAVALGSLRVGNFRKSEIHAMGFAAPCN